MERSSRRPRLPWPIGRSTSSTSVANGRVHLTADVERAYERIRLAGFDIVNLDLIVGLVGETDLSFFASLERVIGLRPESVTLYQLEIPLNTAHSGIRSHSRAR